ncbi:MAG TPA: penicillin-binding protein 1C [Anaeromyxobacteraceae bacterium]|nr:penicillin-binding protein 1C [Anaeromyxobacteraceae bacterium]
MTGAGDSPRSPGAARLLRGAAAVRLALGGIHARLGARGRRLVAATVAAGLLVAWLADLRSGLASPRPSLLVVDRRGAYLAESAGDGDAFGYWPLPDVLPERIVRATVETEDRRFFTHAGVSPRSLARALWQDLRSLRVVSGGSTLAMQTARLQTPGRRTLLRKVKEMAEALLMVRRHGHERVLRQYLTLAPYGHRVRGVVRAARLYFDKPVEDLSWAQAAFLAALPQAPGRMDPYDAEGRARATRRAHRILRTLRARGAITEDELAQALQADLGIVPKPRRNPAALHAALALAERSASLGGHVRTATLDLEMQEAVARIAAENLGQLRDRDAGNTAVLVVDTSDGAVLAHVGSADYFAEEERGAIDYARVPRSPGSALKPFVYGTALELGTYTVASEVEDTPLDLGDEGGRAWRPENANRQYFGPMLVRQALGNSRNVPALRVAAAVTPARVQALLDRAGLRAAASGEEDPGLAIAIGALPATLEELSAAYLALARGGVAVPLRRFQDEPESEGRRILSAEATALVTDVLSDAEARRPAFPAGGPLDFDHAVAVKTGTSQGSRDAWAVAYSDRLLVAVWVGNHDRRRMAEVTGQTGAAPAVHAVMEALMPLVAPHRPVALSFPLPERLVRRTVCALSGRLASKGCPAVRVEPFVPGTEPTEPCPWHHEVAIDARNGLRAGSTCPPRSVVKRALLDLPERYAGWARAQRLAVAPLRESPLCRRPDVAAEVALVEPRAGSRFLVDPEAPKELSTIRFAARVAPADEPVVFLVDGVPVAKVGYPHEFRWPAEKGSHVVAAALARRPAVSREVRIVVGD